MPYIKFQTSPKSGGNSGSCAQILNYLEKESKGFFEANRDDLSHSEAKNIVEHKFYKKGVGKDDSKHYSVVFSFSQEELEGKTDKELIDFAKANFAETYCNAIKGKEQDPSTIAWVGKLEKNRKYKGDHPDVLAGLAKSGQNKKGDNRHIHFVVARKTLDDKKVSPMSNHFRKTNKGAVKSGFDQDLFKIELEKRFDMAFTHSRDNTDKVEEKLRKYRPDLVQGNKSDLDKIQETNIEKIKTMEANVQYFKDAVAEKDEAKAGRMLKRLNSFFQKLFKETLDKLKLENKDKNIISTINSDIISNIQKNKKSPPKAKKPKDRGMGM